MPALALEAASSFATIIPILDSFVKDEEQKARNVDIDRPALLGGEPIFKLPVAFNQPTLPPYDQLSDDIREVLLSGQLTNGRRVAEFEKKASTIFGRPAVAVSSCTSGLILAIKLLGLTGQVIVPSFTFFATSHALIWNGLEPLFVDIDPDTWNIDIRQIEAAINPQVSAILAVDVFGNPSDKTALADIARKYDLKLLTDSAHGLGGAYRGLPIGGFGEAEIFSLSPTKVAVAGEGGLISVADSELARQLRVARDYGNPGDYDCRMIGLNARMTEVNAILGAASLSMLTNNVRRRNEIAKVYKQGLANLPGLTWQTIDEEDLCTYKDISILIEPREFGLDRDELAVALEAEGIPTKKYYSVPAHRQTAYTGYFSVFGDLSVTARVSDNILSLPVYSHMAEADIVSICKAVQRIHRYAADIQGV